MQGCMLVGIRKMSACFCRWNLECFRWSSFLFCTHLTLDWSIRHWPKAVLGTQSEPCTPVLWNSWSRFSFQRSFCLSRTVPGNSISLQNMLRVFLFPATYLTNWQYWNPWVNEAAACFFIEKSRAHMYVLFWMPFVSYASLNDDRTEMMEMGS